MRDLNICESWTKDLTTKQPTPRLTVTPQPNRYGVAEWEVRAGRGREPKPDGPGMQDCWIIDVSGGGFLGPEEALEFAKGVTVAAQWTREQDAKRQTETAASL